MPENPLMPIGQVAGAHGINGAVKIHYFDARHRAPISGDSLRLILPHGSEANYPVKWTRPHKRNHLVGLAGIADRSQAESLAGAQIVIRRSDLPEIEDADTHYWVDLIGLDVYTAEDRYLGQIKAIIPTGSNDVYVVSDEQTETLVPALKNVIIDVNLEANTMRVDLPEGL
jgi:16S rRNA processing protein RimM